MPSTWVFARVFDLALEPPAGVISLQVSFPEAKVKLRAQPGHLIDEGESE